MSCSKCLACVIRPIGVKGYTMAALASGNVSVRSVAEEEEMAIDILSRESFKIKELCINAAKLLLEADSFPPLFHQRYYQSVNPKCGIELLNQRFVNGLPPDGSVLFIFEPNHRQFNGHHIWIDLIGGYMKFDYPNHSHYSDMPNVPLQNAVYIHGSGTTDFLGGSRNPTITSFKYGVDNETGLVDTDSLTGIQQELSNIQNVKLIVIDTARRMPYSFGGPTSLNASSQWLNWVRTSLGSSQNYFLIMTIDESEYKWQRGWRLEKEIVEGVNAVSDCFVARYNEEDNRWDCKFRQMLTHENYPDPYDIEPTIDYYSAY